MVEEANAHMKQMKKNQQELREILARNKEEHREQMAQMMQVIMRLSREKRVVDDAGFVNTTTRVQGGTKGPVYSPASLTMPEKGIPHYPIPPMANAIPKTYPLLPAPMPSGGVYTYPYMPPPMIPSPPITQPRVNLMMLFTQSLPIQSSEEQKEQKRKNIKFMIQLEKDETQ